MQKALHSSAAIRARDYYNSDSADSFYSAIWGGEDIHIGIYNSDDEDIFTASRRTVVRMASLIPLNENSRVLDIGSGFGGSARFLAKNYGCKMDALNISEIENRRNRSLCEKQGLDHLIEVFDGDFENLPYSDESFDVVWSQDAILHSGNREIVIEEAARVLKSKGEFIFTDIMQSDDCIEIPQPILDRICLETLGSVKFYRKTARQFGLKEIRFDQYASHITTHYRRVLEETEKQEGNALREVSNEYITNMKEGLQHWIDACNDGILTWGIFHFSKHT